jgi:choline-sulfatase
MPSSGRRLRARASVALVLAAGAAGAAGCSRVPDRPDILLVTIDTLRADHCSAYGYDRPTTPRMDALARRGVHFEVAYAPMATTAPAHATLFTGLLPHWHGMVKNGLVLAPGHRLLARALGDAGYRTAAVVSSFVLDRRFGLDEGFASYDDRISGRDATLAPQKWQGVAVDAPFDRRADETRERAVAWLRENGYLQRGRPRDQPPFFLWVHFFDPHYPYDPPPAHRERFPPVGPATLDRQVAEYDAEIHFADEQLGGLLDALAASGGLERTVTVVTGDHGEGLMQHGRMQHGLHLDEEAVRVPLVVHWPGGLDARRVERAVQLADLAPTLAELAGVPWTERLGQGRSLKAVMAGRAQLDPAREVFLQRRRYESRLAVGEKYALRSGRWKYIEGRAEGSFELYDLVADPLEQRNLLSSAPPDAATLPGRLARWVEQAPAIPAAPAVDADAARKLRSLGYVE